MIVRGAPAIGVAAAYGMALAELNGDDIEKAYFELKETRPTAVNLFWALEKVIDAKNSGKSLLEEAKLIHEEDIESYNFI